MLTLALGLLIVAAASFVAGISSSEAQEKARPILGEEAKEVVSLARALEVGADSYWVFFHSIYSPKKVVIAVSDSEGAVVENENRLQEIGRAVYKYAVIEEYLKKNGWGFGALEPVMTTTIQILSENSQKLSDFEATMAARYPTLSFNKIESNLLKLSDEAISLEGMLREGSDLQNVFENDYSSNTLEQMVLQYNASLKALYSFLNSYDAYSQSISDVQSQAYKSNITDPDFTSINKNLEALRDVGIKDLYGKLKREKPFQEFNRLLQAENNAKWVNDSIQSFLFKKTRLDAINVVEENRALVEAAIRNEAGLKSCGFEREIAQVKKDWSEIHYFLGKASTVAYQKIIEKMPLLKKQVDDLANKYEECINPPAKKTAPQTIDLTPVLWLVVIIAAALLGYEYWKKRREAEFSQ